MSETFTSLIPAAFGRLCVETRFEDNGATLAFPAAFGRLCVETLDDVDLDDNNTSSRLRAAVC